MSVFMLYRLCLLSEKLFSLWDRRDSVFIHPLVLYDFYKDCLSVDIVIIQRTGAPFSFYRNATSRIVGRNWARIILMMVAKGYTEA